MRLPTIIALLLAFPAGLYAQEPQHQAAHEDADQAVPAGGALPAGWTARPDGDGKLTNARIVTMGDGIHVTLGPAVILYKASTDGKGPFHTLATFTQTKPTEHAEGYGLFAGGHDLAGPAESYVYFLVRQDGSYLIKRRDGDKTSDISKGWVADPAVHKPDAKGAVTNLLEIDHKRDPAKAVFLVNGKAVHTADAGAMNLDGIVGLRVNHNLDVHVAGFDVHR